MLGGLGTVWGPVLGAAILIPASDIILFSFGGTAIHLAILGSLMMGIILFLPRGILPSVRDFIEARRNPVAAHADARTMEEQLHAQSSPAAGVSEFDPAHTTEKP
jgi:hypothetical protein